MATPRGAVIALTHGGGPLPLFGHAGHAAIIEGLKTTVPSILKLDTAEAPKAIAIVTAHWETDKPTISSAKKHDLYFDYYNFPAAAYELTYPAAGDPEIAQQVFAALKDAGVDSALDSERGWDHGVFVPMLLINPSGSIPIIQISVLRSQSPAETYRMGAALSKLRDQNIAIIGSGSASFHNLRFIGRLHGTEFKHEQAEWAAALDEAVLEEDATKRGEKLESWRQFPHAYDMHPKDGSEHFSPLVVCAGAAGHGRAKTNVELMMSSPMTTYYWD